MSTALLGNVSHVGRSRRLGLLIAAIGVFAVTSASAQSPSATLTGIVVDTTGAVLPAAQILVRNLDTSVSHQVEAAADGAFTISVLPPGRYIVRASHTGFSPAEVRNLVLNVGDRTAIRVVLDVASVGDAVTVTAEARRISASPAVGTVVDRRFVENLPLNGRSLQSLFELTPGVVPATGGSGFSVNGQRTNANYVTVDGASANTGILSGPGSPPAQSGSGQTMALTSLGGTSGLVSVDALQEFRIETSSYAPQFGRTPGGQISLVTRSGTNTFHGSVFDSFRHDAMDATDWFVNRSGQEKAKLRQQNFGGVFGGPILRSRTFFFGSYEGLRLKLPQARLVTVPTVEVRRGAAAVWQPYLDAIPLPNGRNLGGGLAELNGVWSDPAQSDATTLRVDHNQGGRLGVFGRVSHAPSYSESRSGALNHIITVNQRNTSITAGSTWTIAPRLVHDVRVNYTSNHAPYTTRLDDYSGAIPPPLSVFEAGREPANTLFTFSVSGPSGAAWTWGTGTNYKQRQLNIVDSVTFATASHELKAGFDFRRMNPILNMGQAGTQSLSVVLADLPRALARSFLISTTGPDPYAVTFDNLSVYAQDVWRIASRFTLTYGLRWELIPPPQGRGDGEDAITLESLDDPLGGQVRLAPRGTLLWKTRLNTVAPRVGATYILSERPSWGSFMRAGTGVFHDLGYGAIANAFVSYPFIASKTSAQVQMPLSGDVIIPPVLGVDRPVNIYVADRNLRVPFTYQWNVSVEQAFGSRQTLTLAYVGSNGQDLLTFNRYLLRLPEWPGTSSNVYVNRNAGRSNYQSVQVHFQRRVHGGLQAQASYTFGRSRDTASSDAIIEIPGERVASESNYGYSDFDARHIFTAAVTYQIPGFSGRGWAGAATRGWGADLIMRARSGTPTTIVVGIPFPPDTETGRPNIVPGQPLWSDDVDAAGGRRLNARAFAVPPANTQGDLVRGQVRGFAARQVDLAVRRAFVVSRAVRLQVRAEMFNLFNTPNFANPTVAVFADAAGNVSLSNSGAATTMLNRGFGGLNALYQMGGSRSTQISLKMLF